jgi:hypothetical protein
VRLLLDNKLSPQLVGLLADTGHEVEHVRDHDLRAAADEDVLAFPREHHLTLVSADTDFGLSSACSSPARPLRPSSRLGAWLPVARSSVIVRNRQDAYGVRRVHVRELVGEAGHRQLSRGESRGDAGHRRSSFRPG